MRLSYWYGLLVLVLLLTACEGGPSSGVQTAAVETVEAAMTRVVPAEATEPPPAAAPSTAPASSPAPSAAAISRVASLPDPAEYGWSTVVDGFSRPLDVQAIGDGRLFVVEQAGRVWQVVAGERLDPPFLDIRSQVGSDGNEQGLLGLAFHPRFTENGQLFVNYTDLRGDTVIARFTLDPATGRPDPASEAWLLTIDQPYGNHNGGDLAFGPDGYLYIGTGDGGSGGDPLGNGQSLGTPLGKILRLDVDAGDPYTIPPDNPFVGNADVRQEIWAFGLRNPWRFAFDPTSGDLYVGDVGQGDWEEINFQPAASPGGENYGWNVREASHPFSGEIAPGMVDPVAEYGHDQGCSVTGGVVVRDPGLPAWNGVYLYGDYCSGRIWGLLPMDGASWQAGMLFDTDFNITSFGQDPAGAVYLLDQRGGVYRLVTAG
jgi:glucose/arabinose dehydrogenase